MSLNIGCGSDAFGDVRVDVRRTTQANLLASAEFLPFRDQVFSVARMFHVLEHCKNPTRASGEAMRVSNTVHAKFPYKWDRIPFVLEMLTTFNFREVRNVLYDCFWHFLTQVGLSDHPTAHRWRVLPRGLIRLNKVFLPGLFTKGRKARFLSRLTLGISAEWECWFSEFPQNILLRDEQVPIRSE